MATQSKDTATWMATISISLVPINSYGDQMSGSTLEYCVYLDGSLVDIVTRLEMLKAP